MKLSEEIDVFTETVVSGGRRDVVTQWRLVFRALSALLKQKGL